MATPAARTALITGASAGIGAAFAAEFASHGHNLVLVARRADKLREIASQLESEYKTVVTILPLDLSDPEAGEQVSTFLEEADISVDMLVNNAGYALNGGLLDVSWNEHQAMQQVMLTSYFELCYRLLPGMVERGYGRIINVSSLAAMMPATPGNLYAAIKRYVNDMSLAIDYEFRDSGVQCCAICPGFTYTEFHDVMGVRDRVSKMPKYLWQSAAEVAQEGYEAVMAGKLIVINGRVNRVWAWLMALLPRSLQYRGARARRPA
ncbi:MAG: SDR family oxidoreductase [Pseudomonadota bacterium]